MRFTFPMGEAPLPGERFQFGVGFTPGDRGGAPIRVEAVVGGLPQATLECPDPPCHEMYLYIAPAWEEARLDLVARSAGAETITVSLPLGRPRPRPMATAG